MSSILKLRRGSAAASAAFTGQAGEVTFNIDTKELVAHDGVAVGGFPAARKDLLAHTDGSALIGHLSTAIGAVPRTVQDKLRETISIMDFGALGDGVDDHAALSAFFTASAGKLCLLPAGVYRASSLLSKALTNCTFVGVPGQTTIIGSFGYAVMRLLDCSNVEFRDIIFKTDYVSAAEDNGESVVYSYQDDVTNVRFRHCKFTSPSANTSGLTFYARITAGDTSGTIDGLWIEDCDFVDVGRIGCTIMNRNTNAFSSAQRVYFNRNRGKNMGTQGSYGFLVSFDGYGQHFECNGNLVENALGIGIENTRWRNGEFRGNRFRHFVRAYAPMSFSGAMTGLLIEGNRTLEASTSRSNFIGVSSSRFRDNYLEATGDHAFHLRNASNNVFDGDIYKSNNLYAALIGAVGATTTDNLWVNCTFDTSGSAANTSVVRFDGPATTRNLSKCCTIKIGTGGSLADQSNSAIGNFVEGYLDGHSVAPSNYLLVSMGDANYSFSPQNQVILHRNYRFNGTLTAGRTVTFPDGVADFTAWNNTAHQLTVKPLSGAGVVIFPGQRVSISSNGTDFLGAGSFSAGWSSTQGILALGDYKLWVDATGNLRIKFGSPTSDTDGSVVGTQT